VRILSSEDFARRARANLPHFLYEYIAGGSFDEITAAANRTRLQAVKLKQRVLHDVARIDMSTTLFGQRIAMPIVLGPVGLAGLCATRGEAQAARAAVKAQIPFCLSNVSVCDIAEVSAAVDRPIWFQLYMTKDRAFTKALLSRAAEQCSVLVFTVDTPVPALRYRDLRSGLSGARGFRARMRRSFQCAMRPAWAWKVGYRGRPHTLGNLRDVVGARSGMEDFAGWIARNFDPSVTWADLAWVREQWKGPFIIKGLLDPADASAAAKIGADGIVVSNHGGRQLDGVDATIDALPAIAELTRETTTILVDGGVRSGLDVLKMLGSGAHGVLLGRAWALALAAGGESGVTCLLDTLRSELHAAMALTGTVSLAQAAAAIAR